MWKFQRMGSMNLCKCRKVYFSCCCQFHKTILVLNSNKLSILIIFKFCSLDFTSPTGNSRQGRRMMAAPSKKDTKPSSSSSKISSKIGESWIEILHGKDPSPKSRKLQPVAVGEDVTLVISTKVMRKLLNQNICRYYWNCLKFC